MGRQIFVNLPVRDLQRSIDFFTGLGFELNPRFTDDKATCMVVGNGRYVMLLAEHFFRSFTTKDVCNTVTHTESIIAVSADSREDVDDLVNKALAAGGRPSGDRIDDGPMYGWSFQDLDGHLWEVIHMDPAGLAP